jgi:hypothetical protein
MAGAMRNPVWRFWAVEHPALMILAVVFGHAGRIAGRRRPKAAARRAPLVWLALGLLVIAAATPWPFLGHGRPWVRF